MKGNLIWDRVMDNLKAVSMELLHEKYASATVMMVKKNVHGNYTNILDVICSVQSLPCYWQPAVQVVDGTGQACTIISHLTKVWFSGYA